MRLCDLETSKALQKLGYDGELSLWINKDDGTLENDPHCLNDCHIPCPRLDDAAYFLREKYSYAINIYPYSESEVEDKPYMYEINEYNRDNEYWHCICWSKYNMTYDDALNEAVMATIRWVQSDEIINK